MHTATEHKKAMSNTDSPFHQGQYVVVNKPLGWSSFDVVNRFRYILSKKLRVKRIKVGHAGTLDPLATGVVVLCTGKYTKRIEEVQAQEKTYIAKMKLGATTPTYDLESEVNAEYPTAHITEQMVVNVLGKFEGAVEQVPPLFSALKVDGTRAYLLARAGQDMELPARTVHISSVELKSYNMPEIEIEVACGKGTYIRSLARDIGAALNSGAHLTALQRTAIGNFTMNEAIEVDDFDDYIDTIIEEGTR